MTLTRKGAKAAEAVATSKYILESDQGTVASGEKEKEDGENLESKKRDKSIAEWIGRPFKPPSRNEDEEDEEKEEYVGAPLDSTEDRSPGTKYDEGCEDDWDKDGIYDREYTVLCDAEDNVL